MRRSLLLLLVPSIASAHGFESDPLVEPLIGWRCVVALIAIGLWAAQIKGPARYALIAFATIAVSLFSGGTLLSHGYAFISAAAASVGGLVVAQLATDDSKGFTS